MKTLITLLTLAALPLFSSAADVTGTWKANFDTQRGLQKYTFIRGIGAYRTWWPWALAMSNCFTAAH